MPASPALKPRSQWRVIGKDRRRVDAPRIVAGEPLFASDVQRPGMKFASVVRCPVAGGKPKTWDDAKARAVPGVRLVAPISAGLAVVADDTWAALSGRDALEPTIVWDEGPERARSARPAVLASLRVGHRRSRGRAFPRAATLAALAMACPQDSRPSTSIRTRPTPRWSR